MPTRDRRRRVSASPLIDPEVCGLVLLAPDQQAYATLREPVRRRLARNLLALTTAARMMDVPVFVSWPADGCEAFAAQLAPGAEYRHFQAGPHPSPWLDPEFVAALAKEDRRALLIGGFWLEHQVLATGLYALAAAYDVYVLADVTPPQSNAAAHLSHNRLLVQGGRPVVTSQVIHEWSLAASADERVSLEGLLENIVERRRAAIDSGLAATS